MPVRSVIYKAHRLVVTLEEGTVTFSEMKANQDRLLADPDFEPTFNQLSDATMATDTDLIPDNIRTLFTRRVFSAESRRAIVAPTAFAYGMARMLGAYSELSKNTSRVQVFRDRASALEWLGIFGDDLLRT